MNKPLCKDCRALALTSLRKAPYPGPRCATHHRERKRALSRNSHAQRVEATYGITADEYWTLWRAQGGVCAICQRATGKTRRLSVDHDHKTGFVRGLVCRPCNSDVLGHLRDSVEALQRAIDYLEAPPAFDVIGMRVVPQTGS